MPKKDWTPEERKAFGEKMKAAREKKNAQTETQTAAETTAPVEPTTNPDGSPQTVISQEDLAQLLNYVKELESQNWRNRGPGGPQVTTTGVVGTIEKFSTNMEDYENPIERLMREERLKRFAFDQNYELGWEVKVSNYETKDGLLIDEPRFELELIRKMYDDEGTLTNGRYAVCRLIMHEDPQAAIQIAKENNIEIEEEDEKRFLDEMRYLRARDWLLECFYPKPITKVQNKRDMVVEGRLVQYWEINDEGSSAVPFDQLDKKKKLRV